MQPDKPTNKPIDYGKVVLSLSGGLDSSTLLFKLLDDGKKVLPIAFDYGQRHKRELERAAVIVEWARAKHGDACAPLRLVKLDFGDVLAGSSQTDPSIDVPEGHYAEASMRATIVPNRNMMFLSICAAIAIGQGAYYVGYAAHAGDHAVYPDCRPDFTDAMDKAFTKADYRQVKLLTPFVRLNKQDIVEIGQVTGVPLALTYSCYKGGEVHCGKCGTCVERQEAFTLAGVVDATLYE